MRSHSTKGNGYVYGTLSGLIYVYEGRRFVVGLFLVFTALSEEVANGRFILCKKGNRNFL